MYAVFYDLVAVMAVKTAEKNCFYAFQNLGNELFFPEISLLFGQRLPILTVKIMNVYGSDNIKMFVNSIL